MSPSLPIEDADGNPIGSLEPLSPEMLADRELMERLSRWRNHARGSFLTQFHTTAERTRTWLQNVVLCDPQRGLYLVTAASGRPIGHVGYKGRTEEELELDNFLRGEIGGHPRIIEFAERTLLRWAFESLKVSSVRASVLADNPLALALHESFGFKVARRVALEVRRVGEEIHLVPWSPGAAEGAESSCSLELLLEREWFR